MAVCKKANYDKHRKQKARELGSHDVSTKPQLYVLCSTNKCGESPDPTPGKEFSPLRIP